MWHLNERCHPRWNEDKKCIPQIIGIIECTQNTFASLLTLSFKPNETRKYLLTMMTVTKGWKSSQWWPFQLRALMLSFNFLHHRSILTPSLFSLNDSWPWIIRLPWRDWNLNIIYTCNFLLCISLKRLSQKVNFTSTFLILLQQLAGSHKIRIFRIRQTKIAKRCERGSEKEGEQRIKDSKNGHKS